MQQKTSMGESYKNALEKKQLDKLRRQANTLLSQSHDEHRVIKEDLAAKYQKKISAKEAEIKYLEAEVEHQKQRSRENGPWIVAIVMLVFFAILVIGGIIMVLHGVGKITVACVWGISLAFLCGSLVAQSVSLDKEKYARRAQDRLKTAKKELNRLKRAQKSHKPSH